MKQLEVYFNDIKAGILSEQHPGTGYSFQYDEEYLKSAMPPISATLPKKVTAYSSEHLDETQLRPHRKRTDKPLQQNIRIISPNKTVMKCLKLN